MWYSFYMASKMDLPSTTNPVRQHRVTLGERGRLVLPAALRKTQGLKEGDQLIVRVEEDGSLRILSLRDQLEQWRGRFEHLAPERSLADELIEERRAEVNQTREP